MSALGPGERLTRAERVALGRRRIGNILRTQTVAGWRTLENKIADGGPNNQRVDPHLLTEARRELVASGHLLAREANGAPWYYLSGTPETEIVEKLRRLLPIHERMRSQDFTIRSGQALEIAIARSLAAGPLDFLGGFPDLAEHDDSLRYTKVEPPYMYSGRVIPGKRRLDFLVIDATAGAVGIEAKNIREWLYPDRKEIRDLLLKCCAIHAVPVLIARRFSYATFSLLNRAGVIVHQTFNQRFPAADAELAELARDKSLLGYHDIRLGNEPDARLNTFLHENLPSLIAPARQRFLAFRELLHAYGSGEMDYKEFSSKLRQRSHEIEDHPHNEEEEPEEW